MKCGVDLHWGMDTIAAYSKQRMILLEVHGLDIADNGDCIKCLLAVRSPRTRDERCARILRGAVYPETNFHKPKFGHSL